MKKNKFNIFKILLIVLPSALLLGILYVTIQQIPPQQQDEFTGGGLSTIGKQRVIADLVGGYASDGNTTTDTLSPGETYTGTAELNGYTEVMTSTFSDTAGTLFYDFSVNGTDWRTFPPNGFVIATSTHEFHTAVKGPRYFRSRFVNSGSTQTVFQHYTYYAGNQLRQGNAPLSLSLSQDSDAIVVRSVDSMLDISADRFGGFNPENKFGRAPAGVQSSATDIWDRADATPTQQIWTAPTQARQHVLTSTSNEDSDSGGDIAQGTGARTVMVFGLTGWTNKETSETVTMDGTSTATTTNSYVIIHRMRVATAGGSANGGNVGTITATAITDNTITAQINPTEGSTLMAVYGVPSSQTAYITQWYATINKASGAVASIDFRLRINNEPDIDANDFITRNERGLQSTGTSSDTFSYNPYFVVSGPAIIKVQGIGSANDIDASAGFDLILVDN